VRKPCQSASQINTEVDGFIWMSERGKTSLEVCTKISSYINDEVDGFIWMFERGITSLEDYTIKKFCYAKKHY
jgi:hypothetical protein